MNRVINNFFLFIVLLPGGLYRRLGVNLHHLRCILKVKLIMDDRRPNTFQQASRKKNKVPSQATLMTILVSAVMGAFYLIAFSMGNDFTTQLTVYFSMYIFMLASILISDFTSVLIDIRDNYIILPKPVNDRTVVVARLLHIMIHIGKVILPMTLPAFIYMAIGTSAGGALAFMAMILLATLFAIFLINALYLLILKITTPQKFQRIISSFQIVFAILMYASYQIVPRLAEKSVLEKFDISSYKWVWVAPPFWFAKAWTALAELNFSNAGVSAIALAVFVPLASVFVVVRYFAPSFNQKLLLINNSSPEATQTPAKQQRTSTSSYSGWLAKWFTKKGAERMGFLLCWKMTNRSKDFKMKVYPAIGYMIVIAIMPFLRSRKLSLYMLQHDPDKAKYAVLIGIYFSSFLITTAISQLMFSDKYKAAWIYYSSPLSNPGEIISGAVKSAITKFYLPIASIISIAGIALLGPAIIPHLLLGFFNVLLICLVISYLTFQGFPFSIQQNNNQKSGAFLRGLFTLLFPATVAMIHFFIYKYTIAVLVFAVLSIAGTWLVQQSIKSMEWRRIKAAYED